MDGNTGNDVPIGVSTKEEQPENSADIVEETLRRLQELSDSLQSGVNASSLQTAIFSLRNAQEKEAYGEENRGILTYHLLNAVSTRFGVHRWIEDLDECFRHLEGVEDTVEFARKRNDRSIAEVNIMVQLVQECRSSLDAEILRTIIRTAEETLSSQTKDELTERKSDLLIMLGNAVIVEYLSCGEAKGLDRASKIFHEIEREFASNTPLVYISLTSLSYIELLRFVECGDTEGLARSRDYMARANKIDEEGSNADTTGMKMEEDAVEDSELDEAITHLSVSLQHRTAPHPRRGLVLHNLAHALLGRFEWQNDMKDLEDAILLSRQALELQPVHHPHRSLSLNSLALGTFRRLERLGTIQDLQDSIALHRECLELQQAPHPKRPFLLHHLGRSLIMRFNRLGDKEDVQEALALLREAVSMTPLSDPNFISSLDSLANILSLRYRHNGNLGDLEESITVYRRALNLQPAPHPNRFLGLHNLAIALKSRFGRKGALEDLEQCITLIREALDLGPVHHPIRPLSLNVLADGLFISFEHTGSFHHLEDSISLRREALALQPIPHPNRFLSLVPLAAGILRRFQLKGASQDLEESIEILQETMETQRLPLSMRPTSLNQLATALIIRFEQNGTSEDLHQCIVLYRESLSLQPASDPNRPSSLGNLASALLSRFQYEGAFQDLEECITLYRDALELRPIPHPDRSSTLNNLATALLSHSQQKGTHQDLEECIVLQREALDLQTTSHPNRSMSLNTLAQALSLRFERKGDVYDLDESIGFHREALNLQPSSHPDRYLTLGNLSASLSMRFRNTGNSSDLEECITLNREALRLGSPSHIFYPVALRNLATALFESFAKTSRLEDCNESISLYIQALNLQPAPHPGRLSSLFNLAKALYQRFDYRNNDADIRDAKNYFEEASKYKPGALLLRFDSARKWAICAQVYHPVSALPAHTYAIELLPLLASLDLTLQQRQEVLEVGQDLVGRATRCAIEANDYETAVRFLSTGRSVFWSQALQLRTPVDKLTITHPTLAAKFLTISRQLEKASFSNSTIHHISNSSAQKLFKPAAYESLYNLADRRQHILDEIRKVPGFEEFLLPPSFSSLQPAADRGPVIFLNASRIGCDALIIHGTMPTQHVPLPEIQSEELEELKMLVHTLLEAGTRSIDVSSDRADILRKFLGRDLSRSDPTSSNQDTFQLVLERLWVKIVSSVVNALQIKKTETPKRVWWCPTGPFTSLPIHAAGIYSDDDDPIPIDCLFQYVVSSYCTAPQDLLHLPPPVAQDFKMTAIIEPEAPGATALPSTREELKKIENHIPEKDHFIVHVGSKNSLNQLDSVLLDIQHSSFAHFGCHGMQNLKDPLESYLLMSGGKLSMSRIIKECKVPEGALAYLSACETAKGDEVRPDESLSLVATMMFAGFRSVVGTMWSILDEDAPVVADVFYGHLFRNGRQEPPDVRDAAYALHLATKELRAQGKSFFSWVPYVHYGI